MTRDLAQSVVVVTDALSAVGEAVAVAFAGERSRLVLAGRGDDALRDLSDTCRRLGAEVASVPADVREQQDVERLATAAVERFDRIDAWVSIAGVISYGSFRQTHPRAFLELLERNVASHAHAARAVVPQFRRQGGGGVMINVCSVWGRVGAPHLAPYVTSKLAVRALCARLRHDVRDSPGIEVVAVVPDAVKRPMLDRVAGSLGRRAPQAQEVLDAPTVADAIVCCARTPQREVTFGRPPGVRRLLQLPSSPLYRRLVPSSAAAARERCSARR